MSYKYVIVAGGYRTGSTLLYNLLGVYVESANQGRRLGFGGYHQLGSEEFEGIGVVKTHYVGGWESTILNETGLVVMTERNEIDRQRSFERFFGDDADEKRRESEMNEALWHTVMSYQPSGSMYTMYDRLLAQPGSALAGVVSALNIPLNLYAVSRAVDLTRREYLEDQLPPEGSDPDTLSQLHWNHFTSNT